MRNLTSTETLAVAGGNDKLNAKVAEACKGLPDSATVTVSISMSANAGIGGIGGGKDVTITKEVEVSCGDFREAQKQSPAPKNN